MMAWSEVTRVDGLAWAVVGGDLGDSLLPEILKAGSPPETGVWPIEVGPDEFEACIHHLRDQGVRGVAVAHPHKAHAARLAARFFTVRTAMGVANSLRFEAGNIYGQNTEAPAIHGLLTGIEPATALLMGAGSGARSVAAALLEGGWKVRVWARNGMRGRLLQTTFSRYGKLELLPHADPTGCRLIVNATTLGSRAGEKPPVEMPKATRGTVCLDLVYRRVPTEFLRDAALRGFRTIDGRELVVEKAALSLEGWIQGWVPDRERMREAAGLRPSEGLPNS